DAIINGKPVISPIVEKYRLTQEKAEHFIRMQKNGTLYIADDVDAVLSHILNIINGNDPRANERKKFTYTYIWPHGDKQSAGEVIAKEIIAMTSKKKSSISTPQPLSKKSAKVPINNPEKKSEKPIKNITPPAINADTDVRALFGNFVADTEKERDSAFYQAYLQTRNKILALMTEYKMSAYWYEEVMGFDYLFDASPRIVNKIREHCYHITGELGYNYRHHHSHKAKPYLARLDDLKALDKNNLFVPESPACGGFGHTSPYGMVNLDTLKFYEVMVGIDRAGLLNQFRNSDNDRKAVVEIGSGWGGFAYQFHTLFENTTFFCIDLPPTLLFSSVYVRGAC
ncbi:MAG: hypothetical protein AAB276_03280, partial [Pseudomonadota bacterium]